MFSLKTIDSIKMTFSKIRGMPLLENFTKWHAFFLQLAEQRFHYHKLPDWCKPAEILELSHPLTQMYNSPDVTGKGFAIRTFVEHVVQPIF